MVNEEAQSADQSNAVPVDAEVLEGVGHCCAVLGLLFYADPREEEVQSVLALLRVAELREEWPFGSDDLLARAQDLIRLGSGESAAELAREYHHQFVGPGHFKAPAWGSVYLDFEGVVFGDSHLQLVRWMRKNGIQRFDDDRGRTPADQIGKMLSLASWLAQNKPEILAEFVGEHLAPWAPRYFELLETAVERDTYRGLAVLGSATLSGLVEVLGAHVARRKLYL